MTKKKTKSKLPEQQEDPEQPGTVSLDFVFKFHPDRAHEDALHSHSVVRQLNEFRKVFFYIMSYLWDRLSKYLIYIYNSVPNRVGQRGTVGTPILDLENSVPNRVRMWDSIL